MAKNFKQLRAKMLPERRARVHAEADRLEKEMALDQLREALNMTQEQLAQILDRSIGRRIAAVRGVGKFAGRPEHVAMRIAGALRQAQGGFDRIGIRRQAALQRILGRIGHFDHSFCKAASSSKYLRPVRAWAVGTKTSPRMMSRAVRSSAACRTFEGFAGFIVRTTLNSPLGCSTEMVLRVPGGTDA